MQSSEPEAAVRLLTYDKLAQGFVGLRMIYGTRSRYYSQEADGVQLLSNPRIIPVKSRIAVSSMSSFSYQENLIGNNIYHHSAMFWFAQSFVSIRGSMERRLKKKRKC